MRFMMIVKATEDSEAGVLPSAEQLDAMMRYNMELARAGVLAAPTDSIQAQAPFGYLIQSRGQAENYRWPLYGSEGTDRGVYLDRSKDEGRGDRMG